MDDQSGRPMKTVASDFGGNVEKGVDDHFGEPMKTVASDFGGNVERKEWTITLGSR